MKVNEWRAGQYASKTSYLRLFSQPQVRYRVTQVRELFQEAAIYA